MKIINYEKIEKFTKKHADAREPFKRWRELTEAATWHSHEDVKKTFPAAGKYGACTIFDIGGNKYRLITKITRRRHSNRQRAGGNDTCRVRQG